VFGLMALSKNSDAKELCSVSACTNPEGVTLSREANTLANVSNVSLAVGVVALGWQRS